MSCVLSYGISRYIVRMGCMALLCAVMCYVVVLCAVVCRADVYMDNMM